MAYSAAAFDSIRDVPADDWLQVRQTGGDAFLEPRLIETVEAGLTEMMFQHVVVYDDDRRAIAVGSFYHARIDVVDLAPSFIRRIVGGVRRVWPNFLKLSVIMSGLPLTVAQRRICFRPEI